MGGGGCQDGSIGNNARRLVRSTVACCDCNKSQVRAQVSLKR